MNYQVVNLDTWTIDTDNLSLRDAKKQIEHAAPFGIRNNLTGRMVVYRLMRGFTPTINQVKMLPKRSLRLANLNHKFNYHPAQ